MKGKKRKKGSSGAARAVLFCLVSGAVLLGIKAVYLPAVKVQKVDENSISAGLLYLKQQDEKEISEFENAYKNAEIQRQKEAMNQEDYNVWEHFGNIAMLGDSRTKEFAHSNFVEYRRVLAEDGDTILKVDSHLDELRDLNPTYVILQYGGNDIENIGVWDTPEDYIRVVDEKIALIEETLPDAKVFVQSILPCIEPALSQIERYTWIPDWNDAIRLHCESNGIGYIDVTDAALEHPDCYEPDGMHFTSNFYEYWARELLLGVMRYES